MVATLQGVTIHLAVNYGLGRHRINVSDTHYYMYSKVRKDLGVIETDRNLLYNIPTSS